MRSLVSSIFNWEKTSKKRILLTGHTGYLGKHVLRALNLPKYKLVKFKGDVRCIDDFKKYNNIDYVIHMAAPANDFHKYTNDYITSSIIQGTDNAIQFSNEQSAKLIYFSTMGIWEVDNIYCTAKKEATANVLTSSKDTTVLVIPRIYSSDRRNGLIGKLYRNNVPEKDYSIIIEYMDLKDLISNIQDIIKSPKKMIYFHKYQIKNTIGEIKDKYL